jgi:uncharacterized protein (AIM24 family)
VQIYDIQYPFVKYYLNQIENRDSTVIHEGKKDYFWKYLKTIYTMSKYSLEAFVNETKENPQQRDYFELETPHMLEINLNNQAVWTKRGSMVGYVGGINFERQGMLAGGIGNLLKKAISGEGSKLMKAEGNGKLYVADAGKKVRILYLNNESVCVNGNDVLAHEQNIKSDITML